MELLQARWDEGKSVCVGLDSKFSRLPAILTENLSRYEAQVVFNQAIVNATHGIVCAYKPNLAFYRGGNGKYVLRDTIRYINRVAPGVPVILDAKQGDIGNTNDDYIEEDFDWCGADAVTINPYLGIEDGLQPFFDQKNKGIIVLCKTSNAGSGEFQDLELASGELLYQRVARQVIERWNYNSNCALVVGATYPYQLVDIREMDDNIPILIPAVGSQGGDLEATVRAGANSRGQGMIINNSRHVIFASGEQDFAEVAGAAAQKMHDDITAALAAA